MNAGLPAALGRQPKAILRFALVLVPTVLICAGAFAGVSAPHHETAVKAWDGVIELTGED
ncbi:MAG: hypothetical protein LBS27_04980 [Bifidobacteriaceae bacterium]|nr:hypothetical protein [Bifidobacteriaceae bacterium]